MAQKTSAQSAAPLILMVLDGFGHRDQVHYNAILAAHTPHWNALWTSAPRTLLNASGPAVGLPEGQMGNSEVGHLTMGAGRILYQDLTRINRAIDTGAFFENPVLQEALCHAKISGKAVHVMGLLSDGGVHSHEKHWQAVLDLVERLQIERVWLHPFLDGRDTPPQSACTYVKRLQHISDQYAHAKIATIAGRYYAMDRDNRFPRTQLAYEVLIDGTSLYACDNALSAIEAGYQRGETDEFILPTRVISSYPGMQDGDIVVFMNFRGDRARQLCDALINPAYPFFQRQRVVNFSCYVTMTEYDANFYQHDVRVAFPPLLLVNNFSEYISQLGLKQFHLAETEKYAHVTFFFNGGKEEANPGEDRLLIPSPKVATYDLLPEMSAEGITDALVEAIQSKKYDFIIVNYANADMVGHSGDFSAAVKAVEALDMSLARIVHALKVYGGELVITADHGNAELMFDETTNQPHTAHTTELVPFVYVGQPAEIVEDREAGLQDIAPTLLYLLDLPQPAEMTGKSLIKKYQL